MRTCRVCLVEKPLNSDNFKIVKKKYYSHECRACYNARCATYTTAWKLMDPEKKRLKKTYQRYHLTEEEYKDLVQKNNGICWICNKEKATCIDHDHSCCPKKSQSCGKCVRGYLCINCNNAIGRLKDDITILESAIQYLQGHSRS